MSYTCAKLIDEISAQLHGWGTTQDRVTPLSANINNTDSTFTVDFTSGQAVGVNPGVVEIDSEQLYVVSVDTNTNICTVADGFGRGYNGTTAASHLAGAKVITRPRFPRKGLFDALNEVINSVYPMVYVVDTFTDFVTFPIDSYVLPVSPVRTILNAEWQDFFGNWQSLRSYSFNSYDNTFRLIGSAPVGRPIRVQYATRPTIFTSESDTLASTGLPESMADVLTLGVVAQQLPGLDISRAQINSIEQTDRSRDTPASIALQAASFVSQKYDKALAREAAALRKQFRPRIVSVR